VGPPGHRVLRNHLGSIAGYANLSSGFDGDLT
jgi:hypothetical protein